MVKGNPHLNSGLTLVRRVKHCEGLMILTYFQARRLVLQFPGYWKKIGTSWVQNKGLHYSWHSRRRDLHLLIHVPCPPCSTWAGQKQAQRNAAYTVGLCHSWGTINLKNQPYKDVACKSANFALDGNTFIILHSKQIFPLFQREILSLSSKVVCCTNILENSLGQKLSMLLLRRHAKHNRPMKNCLPTNLFF